MKISKVIYTCLTGGYDDMPQYGAIDPSYDYICFSNEWPDGSKQGIWTIKRIPFETTDLVRLSRFAKILPHRVLPEYDYSVYIDSNIIIENDEPYKSFDKLMTSSSLWGGVQHPELDCLYEDARKCLVMDLVDFQTLKKQILHMKSEGYPAHNGLLENNMVIRNHNNSIIKRIDEQWWNMYLKYTKRDQLSLCYILWKNNFKPSLIYPENISTWNAPGITRIMHNKSNRKPNTFIRKVFRRIRKIRLSFIIDRR